MPLRTARGDLLDHGWLAQQLDAPVDVFLSIGLSVWLEPPELAALLSGLHRSLATDGILIIDNFRGHGASRFARDLEMVTRYHAQGDFERLLAEAGFAIEAVRKTRNHVNVIYRCRRLQEPIS